MFSFLQIFTFIVHILHIYQTKHIACRETDLGGGDYYLRNSGLPPSLKLLKKPCTVRVGAKYRRTDLTLGGSNTNPAIVRVRGKTGCGPWSAFLPSSSFLGLFGIPFAWITEGTWNFNEFSAFVGKLFCSARFSSYDHKMWLNATSLRTRAHYFCTHTKPQTCLKSRLHSCQDLLVYY